MWIPAAVLSFVPSRNMLGTDTLKRSAADTIRCPFTGKRYPALPALYPDVGIVHVHRADASGNCQIDGILVSDPLLARASRITCRGLIAGTMNDIMETCQGGMVDFTFLGGAEIDMYGNLNSTMIGDDYRQPSLRLPGSGGANDLGSLCWKTIVVAPMDRRRFVSEVSLLTTPGYLNGRGARKKAGLPAGSGPYRVITDFAVLGYDEETCRMKVESLNPGVSLEDVRSSCGFALLVADDLQETPPPTVEELRTLREEVDPVGYIIGR